MTAMIANVNVCVILNEVEGTFDIYTSTFAKELQNKRTINASAPMVLELSDIIQLSELYLI